MKKILLTVLVAISFFGVQGQVDPLYAQYMNNPLLINPAYSGFSSDLNASVSFRKQWAGFDGAPETLTATGHTSVNDNKMGIGIFISQDKIGVNRNTEATGSFSYRLALKKTSFSFGMQTGFINFRNDFSKLNPQDPSAPEFASNVNDTKFTLGAGALLTGERFFVGLSVPRMLKSRVRFGETETSVYEQHFYATGAYLFILSPQVKFKPTVLIKAVQGAPLSIDYNASFTFDDRYSVGAFTRNLQAYGVIGQLRLDEKYRIGYTFEVPTDNSVGSRFVTHEVMLGVNLSVFNFHDQFTIRDF